MKIETATGDVIDLDYMREAAQFEDIDNVQVIAVIDTLKAALNVPTPYLAAEECSSTPWSESDIFQRGLRRGAKTMLDAVRQAAGVIEESV